MQKREDIDIIKNKIAEVARQSAIGARIHKIDLNKYGHFDDEEFIRVQIVFDKFASIDDSEMEKLAASIERAVSDLDDRFASVRFSEAA